MLRLTDVKLPITGLALTTLITFLSSACGHPENTQLHELNTDTKSVLLNGETPDGRYVSLKVDTNELHLTWGGESRYISKDRLHIRAFLGGSVTKLKAAFGRDLLTKPADIAIKLVSDKKSWPKTAELEIKQSTGSTQTVAITQAKTGSEFTVVSYNVENLFDQTDEDRNESYGDYRIEPNSQGYSSNYGEKTTCDTKRSCTFTDVKIENIRKALIAIDPQGPEIVALQEIESEAALRQLLSAVKDLGYVAGEFSSWPDPKDPQAIGTAILSKFPIKDQSLLEIESARSVRKPRPKNKRNDLINLDLAVAGEHQRPIFRVELDIHGHPLLLYINHWRSKGAPESFRLVSADAIERDVATSLSRHPGLDYLIVGDLNSNYNEKDTLEDRHNDTGGKTGINDILKAQGNENLMLANDRNKERKFNLFYEQDSTDRRSAFHGGFGWSSFDHIIVGKGLYDRQGITYIDNSHTIADARYSDLAFLFTDKGETKRWMSRRNASFTSHKAGGYSDHAPVFARFYIDPAQSTESITLRNPSQE